MNLTAIDAIERRLAGADARLGVLSRVKNECDVIEAFVRHHLTLVDRVVVVDNGSQDGTREILDALVAEGLQLSVLADDTIEYRQGEIMTYLARASIRAFEFDRLFLLDADEFLHVGSRAELDATLALFYDEDHLRMPWTTYVPDGDDEVGAPPLTIRKRRRAERAPTFKVAIAGSFVLQPATTVAMGSHTVLESGVAIETPIARELRVAHYPVRSLAQLRTKSALAWTSYVAMGYDGGGFAEHWRQLSVGFASGEPVRLRDEAFGYPGEAVAFHEDELVEDPLPFGCTLRYLDLAIPDPSRTIARFAEQMARRYAELRAMLDVIRPELGALEGRLSALEAKP